MSSAKPSQKKKGLMVAVLVALAVWVNFPLLAGVIAPWITDEEVAGADFWDDDFDEDALDLDAALGATSTVFAPVPMIPELVDPFYHPGTDSRWTETASLPGMPEVDLIMCTTKVRRALIAGDLIGEGDQIAVGTVRSIEPTGVLVELNTGGQVLLNLTSHEAVEARRGTVEDGDEYLDADETEEPESENFEGEGDER